jgi:hypothetical protein
VLLFLSLRGIAGRQSRGSLVPLVMVVAIWLFNPIHACPRNVRRRFDRMSFIANCWRLIDRPDRRIWYWRAVRTGV